MIAALPMPIEWQPKDWGRTRPLGTFGDHAGFDVHQIEVERGGYCSWHYHRHKSNMFLVARGELVVSFGAVVDSQVPTARWSQKVLPGCPLTVSPGLWHMFESDDGAEAFEIYWSDGTAGLSRHDIVRATTGGVRRPDVLNAGADSLAG